MNPVTRPGKVQDEPLKLLLNLLVVAISLCHRVKAQSEPFSLLEQRLFVFAHSRKDLLNSF